MRFFKILPKCGPDVTKSGPEMAQKWSGILDEVYGLKLQGEIPYTNTGYFIQVLSKMIIYNHSIVVINFMAIHLEAKGMNYFFDENNVRYTLVDSRGGKALNWLIIPGGPGLDSSYYLSLTKLLNISGNIWLIDLPGNGSNDCQKDNFENWFAIFIPTISKFKNPVIIGQSFGGMFPLLFPELEDILVGFVALNSCPKLWLEDAARIAIERNLPDFSKELAVFTTNPTNETFKVALDAMMPYYGSYDSQEDLRKSFEGIPIQFAPLAWWQNKAVHMPYEAKWIPAQVPTLIIGGEYDAMCPFRVFEADKRFDRDNIQKHLIEGAGHIPWIEKPELVAELINEFSERISEHIGN